MEGLEISTVNAVNEEALGGVGVRAGFYDCV